MLKNVDIVSAVVAAFLMLCWMVFTILFLARKKHPKATQRKRDRISLVGAALVGVGYALVWSVRRPLFTPMFVGMPVFEWVLAGVTILLSSGSVWLAMSAIRELGRQWSLEARLVDDHELVTKGAYAIVRHPIYTGMLGMLIATGLALSVPLWLAIATVFASYGTYLRIKSEETLLREAFGEKYDEYARNVPALIPWIT